MGNGSSSSRSAHEAAPAAPARAEYGVQYEQRQQQPSSTKTVVLKVNFHRRHCLDKVRKKLLLVDGVQSVSTDMENNRVTVKGTMDVDAMLLFLRNKLRKHADVEVVQVEESNSERGGGGGDVPAAENPVPDYDLDVTPCRHKNLEDKEDTLTNIAQTPCQ